MTAHLIHAAMLMVCAVLYGVPIVAIVALCVAEWRDR